MTWPLEIVRRGSRVRKGRVELVELDFACSRKSQEKKFQNAIIWLLGRGDAHRSIREIAVGRVRRLVVC